MTVHYLAVVCNRPLVVMAGDSQGSARFPENFHGSLGATESEV